MAAPTQEYPPWLSPSPVLVTDAAGVVATHTTVIYLPLTYLGPSIPLGSLYTYGGSTYPPTIVTGFITTTSTPPTPTTSIPSTAIPTSLSDTSFSSSATPTESSVSPTESSLSPTTSLPSSIITSIPTSSTISSTSPAPETTTNGAAGTSGGLSRGQLVGVIVASIMGFLFLFVFLLAMWLWCKGRRNRRSIQFYDVTPIDDEYYIVGDDGRTPGEGSPRHSGEEADPFLQPSQTTLAMQETTTDMGSRPPVPRVPAPVAATGSLSSSGSSSTNTSGYGILLERPTLGTLPTMAEEGEFGSRGYQLTPEEMRQLNRESVLPREDEEEYTGAYAIAKDPLSPTSRPVDPDNAFGPPLSFPRPPAHTQPNPRESVGSHHPSLLDAEDAALLTVRRVKVSDISSSSQAGGILGAIGLAGLSNIGRMGWFRGENSPSGSPRNSRHSPQFQSLPLTDTDLEVGRGLLHPALDSFGRIREGAVGLDSQGERPTSHLSATSASGNTVWHDAYSSIPGTPQLALPPRAITPADIHLAEQPRAALPAYDDPFMEATLLESPAPQVPLGEDILDLPVPTALTHFPSSSSMRDTVSSIGLSKYPYPPGLEFVGKGKTWSQDGSISGASSAGWDSLTHRVNFSGDHRAHAVVDVLEEQPPHAQDTWRSMSSNTTGGFGELSRRTTFGLPQIRSSGYIASEQGSLHSMRSHINPPSVRSTGSAAASRRELSGSVSSNSSRPSAHSSSRSTGSASDSINRSVVRSGSITSDGRHRFDPSAPPPRSAFLGRGFQTPPRAESPAGAGLFKHSHVPTIDGSSPDPNSGMVIPPVHMSPGASTIRTVNSGSTAGPGRERTISAMTYGASSSIREVAEEALPLSNPSLAKDWTPVI
ncbi:hypothetical protein FA15DRAFT_597809 [Coprinopsis marcescibilis]|uniref:Uncharacterized protein n=1 Tax=Coprinopsis marcescibilis TaxID=230819 RepID=A0A5C3KM46_COPMA|nr:hypothetical protein FA15DRAFT_597809 [Coprinopsis marcescibilis]